MTDRHSITMPTPAHDARLRRAFHGNMVRSNRHDRCISSTDLPYYWCDAPAHDRSSRSTVPVCHTDPTYAASSPTPAAPSWPTPSSAAAAGPILFWSGLRRPARFSPPPAYIPQPRLGWLDRAPSKTPAKSTRARSSEDTGLSRPLAWLSTHRYERWQAHRSDQHHGLPRQTPHTPQSSPAATPRSQPRRPTGSHAPPWWP